MLTDENTVQRAHSDMRPVAGVRSSKKERRAIRNMGNMENPALPTSAPLPEPVFAGIVANAPLVAIDLIVEDEQGAILVGLRKNPPAQDHWFVPGGRIRKNETIDHAFARISQIELGRAFALSESRFAGVHEHFYDTNFIGMAGATTHYIVLAYRIKVVRTSLDLPKKQHNDYAWISADLSEPHPRIHPYALAYFLN
jgi:colanic acid biosynthesis protein WcaH